MTVQPKWILTETDPTKTGRPTGFKRTWNLFVSNPVHFKLTNVAKISIKCDYVQYKLTWRHGINIEDDSRSKVPSFILLVIASEMYSVYVPRTPLTLNQPPATIYNLGRFTASCYPEVINIHDHDKIHELASICFLKYSLKKYNGHIFCLV